MIHHTFCVFESMSFTEFLNERLKQTKDAQKTTKTSNCVSIVFEQKFGFENSKRHFLRKLLFDIN
eukprot:UN03589